MPMRWSQESAPWLAPRFLWQPLVNQGLVRFVDTRLGASETNHDRRTDAVIAAINQGGEAFFGGTTWRGRRCMRVSVLRGIAPRG
jgi:hypothetical protein